MLQISWACIEISAQTALKAMQGWWLGSQQVENDMANLHNLDIETAILLTNCQTLRKNGFKDIEPWANCRMLDDHVKHIAADLTYDTLLIYDTSMLKSGHHPPDSCYCFSPILGEFRQCL